MEKRYYRKQSCAHRGWILMSRYAYYKSTLLSDLMIAYRDAIYAERKSPSQSSILTAHRGVYLIPILEKTNTGIRQD